jgi:thymidylate kinase
MTPGTYIIFEVADCAVKTTLLHKVYDILCYDYNIVMSKHPGATPLGAHLRKLVKTPDEFNKEIVIDPMSAQLLMMVDQIAFCEGILKPELDKGSLVFADRCNLISAIVYGLSEGLNVSDMSNMYNLVNSPPPDQVFVLQIPLEEMKKRREARGIEKDRFEDQGDEFLQSICNAYDGLTTLNPEISILLNTFVPLDRIKHIDATKAPESLLYVTHGTSFYELITALG